MEREHMRKAGILMPIASLPSFYGVGDFGLVSRKFITLIKTTGFKVWQLLPLNPLGYGNSPYQSYSSNAMDELYISLDFLVRDGYLLEVKNYQPDSILIDYEAVRKYKQDYLLEAFQRFKPTDEFELFCKQDWLNNYAVFMMLKKKNGLKCWNEWETEDKNWIKDKKLDISIYEDEIRYEMFIQFIAFKQWNELHSYANEAGIELIGDIPFYVGIDSVDVWESQDDFLLDGEGKPTSVAGVPPDYFNDEGQRWGNPLYNWEHMRKSGFKFWAERLAYAQELFDVIRIDHFRAFDTYWKIDASEATAIKGEWIEAPGVELFDAVFKKYPKLNLIAEDLGYLRPEVIELRDHFNLMGMRIIQYSLDEEGMKSDRENLTVYTGTHDNETLRSWYSHLAIEEKRSIQALFDESKFEEVDACVSLIQYTLNSKANCAIISILDLLDDEMDSRINTPGTIGNPNWQWKMKDFSAFENILPKLGKMIKESNR